MSIDSQKGLSLVEVILALGLLGAVMISIAGLFVMSQKQIESGKSSSEALSVARAIVEEMNGWSFHQTYLLFGFDGAAKSYSVDSRNNAACDKWQATLDEALGDGLAHAVIDIEALAQSGQPIPILQQSRVIRVTITVNWTEGLRQRSLNLAVVRQ